MKFSHLIEYNKRKMFFQKIMQRGREPSSRPLFVFEKALYEVRASGLQLSFNILR